MPALDYAPRNEDVWGNGCIIPHILNLGTRRRSVVSFIPRYPLNSRQGEPQKTVGRVWNKILYLSFRASQVYNI